MENGYEAGKKPATCKTCGKIFRTLTLSNTSPAMSRRSNVVSWSDSPRDQAVPKRMQSWRTARSLIRLGTKCWVKSLGVKWKQHCRPLWAPERPASRCRLLLVSLLQVNTPFSLVGLLAHFPLRKAYLESIVLFLMDSAESSRCHVPRTSVHPASR